VLVFFGQRGYLLITTLQGLPFLSSVIELQVAPHLSEKC